MAFRHLAGLGLVASGGPWPGPDCGCVGRLVSGCLRYGGHGLQALPLDFQCHGPASLELRFANGTVFHADVLSLALIVPPDARFTDSLAC
ncbi:hypothetical protein [Rhizobacter sp. LjRoot28]|uniref:hypothetical protein n=1 Tax=Rhizobacter sp. LjRoot28 TaxID=3342309 RepID=UPI003ECF666B